MKVGGGGSFMEGVYGQGGGGRKELAGKGEGVQCVQGEGRDGHEEEGEDGLEYCMCSREIIINWKQ